MARTCEDDINRSDNHGILVWVTSVFDDRNEVGSLLSHVQQITTRTVRELHSVDNAILERAIL